MRLLLPVFFALAFAALPAIADDSTAELATSGLVFVHNDAVEMRSEDLFISLDEVRARYLFVNTSNRDVTNLVAFPLPDLAGGAEPDIAVPKPDQANFLGFTTLVNGRPVEAKIEQRVLANGVDRTGLLRKLGVPLAPQLASTEKTLDRLPKSQWGSLISDGLVATDQYDDGHGMKPHLEPRWTLKTTYYWKQTFPAGTETVIEHRYRPSVGGSVGTSIGASSEVNSAHTRTELKKYCIDKQFSATVAKARRANKAEYPAFQENRIDFILVTGANWAAPIKDFRLVIDKGKPDNLLSFCGQRVKKIGPTKFEMDKTNFTPRKNLAILILSPQPR